MFQNLLPGRSRKPFSSSGQSFLAAIITLLTLAAALSSCINTVYAQTAYKTVNNKTYVFDNKRKVIYNQTKEVRTSHFCATEGFSVNNPAIVPDTFKEALSPSRLKELKKDKLAIIFECKSDGKIESMEFVFNKTPFLTATEVEELERLFLKQSFSISSNLEKGQYIKFAIPCFFSRLQDN